MSQAVISSNQSIRVSNRIALTGSTSGVNLLVYTVPANSYAVVNVESGTFTSSGEKTTFFVGGTAPGSGITIYQSDGSITNTTRINNFHMGPGEYLRFNSGNFGTKTYYVNGVEFINSP